VRETERERESKRKSKREKSQEKIVRVKRYRTHKTANLPLKKRRKEEERSEKKRERERERYEDGRPLRLARPFILTLTALCDSDRDTVKRGMKQKNISD